jgi:TatA/E family protein of Tat protein translocase
MNDLMIALIGLPSWAEFALIGLVVLLLFAKRLPMLARTIGQTAVEFKRGLRGGDRSE